MLLEFHKSSYSTAQENCVEVAQMPPAFHKSSHSTSQDNCVEVAQVPPAFRKSSYSSAQDNCVEVADLPTGAAIRDSKNPERGFLPVGAAEWVSFTRLLGGREGRDSD